MKIVVSWIGNFVSGKVASFVGFTSAVLAIYIYLYPENPKAVSSDRLIATDCREEGYAQFEQQDLNLAAESFSCSVKHFQRAAKLNDGLSLWGLSLIYSDPIATELLNIDRNVAARLAVKNWCKAQKTSSVTSQMRPPAIGPNQCG